MGGEEEMKNFFKTNWITLTISFLSAIIIWIYVVYQVNPVFETTIKNVPINYTKYSEEFANGKLVIADEALQTANIKVKGKRTLIAKISKNDINCTVDMSNISSSGQHKLPVNVSFNTSGLELVSKDPYSITINVDDVITEELSVEVTTKGEPKEGYIYDTLEYNKDTVRITGARTIIKNVKKAKVTVDISGKSDPVTGRYQIVLLDKDGNELPEEGITKNISYLEIKCNILLMKEVPISVTLSSEKNGRGKTVTATTVPGKIKLMGSKNALATVSEAVTETVNVRNVKDGDKVTVKLKELPETLKYERDLKEVEIEFKVE